MAVQSIWIPGSMAIPEFVGTRGLTDHGPGLVKARFDQSISPVAGPQPNSDIDWSEIVGHRGQGGAAFRGQANRGIVFSFPIPTPVHRVPGTAPGPNPNQARLQRIFLLSDSQSGVRINTIWVSEVRRVLFNLALDGYNGSFGSAITWGANPRRSNVWEVAEPNSDGPEVFLPITISVFVFFTGDENVNQIIFRAAGADFLV